MVKGKPIASKRLLLKDSQVLCSLIPPNPIGDPVLHLPEEIFSRTMESAFTGEEKGKMQKRGIVVKVRDGQNKKYRVKIKSEEKGWTISGPSVKDILISNGLDETTRITIYYYRKPIEGSNWQTKPRLVILENERIGGDFCQECYRSHVAQGGPRVNEDYGDTVPSRPQDALQVSAATRTVSGTGTVRISDTVQLFGEGEYGTFIVHDGAKKDQAEYSPDSSRDNSPNASGVGDKSIEPRVQNAGGTGTVIIRPGGLQQVTQTIQEPCKSLRL